MNEFLKFEPEFPIPDFETTATTIVISICMGDEQDDHAVDISEVKTIDELSQRLSDSSSFKNSDAEIYIIADPVLREDLVKYGEKLYSIFAELVFQPFSDYYSAHEDLKKAGGHPIFDVFTVKKHVDTLWRLLIATERLYGRIFYHKSGLFVPYPDFPSVFRR